MDDRAKRPSSRKGPSLAGCDLRHRSLVGADLQGADLRDADLRGADLRGADLYGARIDRADLRGTLLDTARLVEIHLPSQLPLEVVNQIRHFDFRFAMTRFVGPNRACEPLPCPYRDATLKPLLYEWGSRTWNGGEHWTPPHEGWTLEEIIAAVLDGLRCRHDLRSPARCDFMHRRADWMIIHRR